MSGILCIGHLEARFMDSSELGKGGAIIVPVERYSPERKAEFLLSTATSPQDYRQVCKEIRKMGLDPESIPHRGTR